MDLHQNCMDISLGQATGLVRFFFQLGLFCRFSEKKMSKYLTVSPKIVPRQEQNLPLFLQKKDISVSLVWLYPKLLKYWDT